MNISPLQPGTFSGLAGPEIDLFASVLSGRGGIGVEIGCLDGFSSLVILGASALHLTSIDPLVPDSMESSLQGDEARLRANLEPFSAAGRWTFVKDYAESVRWETPLDFLFIDGDHSYDAVRGDYMKWVPHLKTGGLLAMHDARMSRPGGANFHEGPSQLATKFVFDRPSRWHIVGEAFSLVIAQKLEPFHISATA